MTPASDAKPVRRLVAGVDGTPFVLEVYARRCVLRPRGSPRGGSRELSRSWAQVYLDAAGGDTLRARGGRRRGRR